MKMTVKLVVTLIKKAIITPPSMEENFSLKPHPPKLKWYFKHFLKILAVD